MNRRNFISTLIGATAMTALPDVSMDPYDRMSLGKRVRHILKRDGTTLKSIHIDPIEEIGGGETFRFVRVWVEEQEKTLTWFQKY